MPSLSLLMNTREPQSINALSRTLLRFCGTTFVETAVYLYTPTHDVSAWNPGPCLSRADKIVISALFASSLVRNNI